MCVCCQITYNPSPPYTKSDSYASVVQQQSALSIKRTLDQLYNTHRTCARTRQMYAFLTNIRDYLHTKSWMCGFRKLHFITCATLQRLQRELEELKYAPHVYACTCRLASGVACNDRYRQLFETLALQYRNGEGFQTQVFNLLSTRMCPDLSVQVMSYMWHPVQFNATNFTSAETACSRSDY